jgi:excisionase family DNA binding protein
MDKSLQGVEQDPAVLAAKPYLDPIEVAVLLGVGRITAYSLIRSKAIPSVRLGRLIKVPTARLLAQLDAAAADSLNPSARISA